MTRWECMDLYQQMFTPPLARYLWDRVAYRVQYEVGNEINPNTPTRAEKESFAKYWLEDAPAQAVKAVLEWKALCDAEQFWDKCFSRPAGREHRASVESNCYPGF